MAWSHAYTGDTAVFGDSFHRIAFCLQLRTLRDLDPSPSQTALLDRICHVVLRKFPVNHETKEKVEEGVIGVRHVIFALDDSFTDASSGQAEAYARVLDAITRIMPRDKFIVTLAISSLDPCAILRSNDSILLTTSPECIFCEYKQTREFTTQMVTKSYELLLEYPTILLGIEKVPDRHALEYILSHIPSDCHLKIYSLGNIVVPNFEIRVSNFTCSKHMNTFAFISKNDLIDPNSAYGPVARKYNKAIPTTITKCALQLGYIVCIRVSSFEDLSFISQYIAELTHPFTYRKPYISPTDIVHFQVDSEDMELVFDASEALESMGDAEWKERVFGMPVARERKF